MSLSASIRGFAHQLPSIHWPLSGSNGDHGASTIPRGAFLASVLLLLAVSYYVYMLHFHPLAKYPGPRIAALTDIWYLRLNGTGTIHLDIEKLHRQYGDIVRIGPNELSMTSPAAWKDIYGPTTKTRRTFIKSKMYRTPGLPPNLVSFRDPAGHAVRRKQLAYGFSSSGLRLQADVVKRYVRDFIEQLGQHAQEHAVDLSEWYSWLTFDIIGDLTFGDGFGAVAAAKPQEATELISRAFYVELMVSSISNIPWMALFRRFLVSKKDEVDLERHRELMRSYVQKRMTKQTNRNDFFQRVLEEDDDRFTEEKLLTESHSLVSAGSDTTRFTLTVLTYNLCRHPAVRERLVREIRMAFTSAKDIDSDRTAALPYLAAVLEENLRIYGAATFGLPRESPGAMVDGHFIPAGTVVSTPLWTLHHHPQHWARPNDFVPERWIPAERAAHGIDTDIPREAFRPFSGGPRGCIGINLAYMELRVTMAHLLWHFDLFLENPPEQDYIAESKVLVLWQTPPLMVRVERVDGHLSRTEGAAK